VQILTQKGHFSTLDINNILNYKKNNTPYFILKFKIIAQSYFYPFRPTKLEKSVFLWAKTHGNVSANVRFNVFFGQEYLKKPCITQVVNTAFL
jgi:hypothetical protein